MNDLIGGVRTKGKVLIDGTNIINGKIDSINLRKKVGMVFKRPSPFLLSVYENVVFGEKVHNGNKSRSELDAVVQESLKSVLL